MKKIIAILAISFLLSHSCQKKEQEQHVKIITNYDPPMSELDLPRVLLPTFVAVQYDGCMYMAPLEYLAFIPGECR